MCLPDHATTWLQSGERCAASNTIITYCTGVDCMDGAEPIHPTTLPELRRCRLLLEQCPELRSCLPRTAKLSREWAGLVSFWDDLCHVHDLEDPEWRTAAGKASQTKKMLQHITEPKE